METVATMLREALKPSAAAAGFLVVVGGTVGMMFLELPDPRALVGLPRCRRPVGLAERRAGAGRLGEPVTQPPARSRFGQVKRIAVAVGERKVRPQHQLTVRAPLDAHVFTEALAQERPQGVDVERHRSSDDRRPSPRPSLQTLGETNLSWVAPQAGAGPTTTAPSIELHR